MKILLFLVGAFSFYITRFDPKLKNKEVEKIFGFIEDHNKHVNFASIGELSLITYNLERKNEMERPGQIEAVKKLLDASHVSVMALQEATESQISDLKDSILPHYNIVEDKTSGILDPLTGETTFLPIIYDSRDFDQIGSAEFKTNDKYIKNSYASWVTLKSKSLDKTFTIVNMNLYSPKSAVVDIQFANILRDIEVAKLVKNSNVVLMGTINSLSEKTKIVMEKGLNVLSTPKDSSVRKNTLNSYNDVLGNIQRDFIISVPSPTYKLQAVYKAILKKINAGIRFPVHAIVNVVRNQ